MKDINEYTEEEIDVAIDRIKKCIDSFVDGLSTVFTEEQVDVLITAFIYFDKYRDVLVPILTADLNTNKESEGE